MSDRRYRAPSYVHEPPTSSTSKGFAITAADGVDVDGESFWSPLEHSPTKRGKGRKPRTEVIRIINPDANPSTSRLNEPHGTESSQASRLFVENVEGGSGLHLDWPIYSYTPIKFREAARIILTEAAEVTTEEICHSIPQEYTESGTFIINMRNIEPRHALSVDGLGSWGKAHGSSVPYNENGEKLHSDSKYYFKVMSNRYVHPGTESIGQFVKHIYSGVSSRGEGSSHAVVTYQWNGIPHPIAIDIGRGDKVIPVDRAFGQRSWEAEDVDVSVDAGIKWRGRPLFSLAAIDFESVCKILLGGINIEAHRVCNDVPNGYTGTGTFIVDLEKAGGERLLSSSIGGRWTKPSGASRLYRLEKEHWIRVDRLCSDAYDVQIFSKRYESESQRGLLRKVYVVREKRHTGAVQSHLAVLTFYCRGDPFDPIAIHHKAVSEEEDDGGESKRPASPSTPTDVECDGGAAAAEFVFPSQAYHIKRLCLRKQSENETRMASILDRAELLLDKFGSAVELMSRRRHFADS